jgi:hypothetical protein
MVTVLFTFLLKIKNLKFLKFERSQKSVVKF